MAYSLGSTRVVITSHPETAKKILSGSAFSDRPIKESANLLMFERVIGFAPPGKYWRHLRRIAANHMFSPRSVSSLECLRHHVCDNRIEKVSKEMSEKRIVDLRGILQKGSLRNIIESVFGSGLGLRVEEELGFMVKEGYELIGQVIDERIKDGEGDDLSRNGYSGNPSRVDHGKNGFTSRHSSKGSR
ncbi:cytochrome P450 78A5-like protein [Tanacetum coccineum]